MEGMECGFRTIAFLAEFHLYWNMGRDLFFLNHFLLFSDSPLD